MTTYTQALAAVLDPEAAHQAACDHLSAMGREITGKVPQAPAEAVAIVDVISADLSRFFPEVATDGPIYAGLANLRRYLSPG